MTAEVLSFPPFTLSLHHDPQRLQTHIALLHAKDRGIAVNALAFEFVADTDTRQLFFHTANSDHPDAATLYSVSLETGAIQWRVPDVQPGGRIVLHPQERYLEAGKPYGTDDAFIVRVAYTGEVLQRNPRSGYEMVDMAETELEAGHDTAAVTLLHRALTTDISPNTNAKVLRHLGEITDRAGDIASAITFYERALGLNPRVGVKKRLAQLRR